MTHRKNYLRVAFGALFLFARLGASANETNTLGYGDNEPLNGTSEKSLVNGALPTNGAAAALSGDGSVAPVSSGPPRSPNDFGGVAPLPGTLREMATGEAPEFYSVEEGDTLYDVCSQLIGDGNFWPKLWSINPDVKNPHFIYPGMKLAFYSGTLENPPYLEVVSEDELLPVEKGTLQEANLITDVVPVANPVGVRGGPAASGSVAQGKSTRQSKFVGSGKAFSETSELSLEHNFDMTVIGKDEVFGNPNAGDGMLDAGRKKIASTMSYAIPALFLAEEPAIFGTIVGGLDGEQMSGIDKRVLVQMSAESAENTFTVLRPSSRVYSPTTGDKIGVRYDFICNVHIGRKHTSELSEANPFGVLTSAISGDILVSYTPNLRTQPIPTASGGLATGLSSVIGFPTNTKTTGSQGDLVFLEKHDMSVGGLYPIFSSNSKRDLPVFKDRALKEVKTQIAVARVLEVLGESALAYIVISNQEVRIGDTTSM